LSFIFLLILADQSLTQHHHREKSFAIRLPFFLLFLNVDAQKKWGLVAGAGLSNVSGYNVSGASTDFLFALQSAVFTMIPLGNIDAVIFKPSIGYSPRGANFKNVSLTYLAGNSIGSGNLKRRLDYIQLNMPVNYKMKWKKVVALVGAGPFAAYAISGREVRNSRFSQLYASEKIFAPVDFEKQSISRFDAGVTAQFTAIFPNNFCMGLHVDLGLTKVNTGGTVSTRNQYGGMYFGYIF